MRPNAFLGDMKEMEYDEQNSLHKSLNNDEQQGDERTRWGRA